MDTHLARNKSLSTIPEKKLIKALENTLRNCEKCNLTEIKLHQACERCSVINKALRRYAESNVPIRYWNLSMKNFQGDPALADVYKNIVSDLNNVYQNGTYICLAGKHGVGKTLTISNILKKAAEKGFSCLYTTLTDVVAHATHGPINEKYSARKEMITVDFLAIDEFDSRYMPTDASSDLFGRQLEDILRKRVENQLPLFMCTNSPNIIETFQGSIKYSIESLMNYIQIVPIVGKDFRKNSNG